MKIKKHIALLGMKVEDRVTGLTGIVSSICFDLYGCIQAAVNPGLDKEGKPKDSQWYDVSRLEVKSKKPVMEVPNYDFGSVSDGAKGPAEKPHFLKP